MVLSTSIRKNQTVYTLTEKILNDCRNLNIEIRLLGSVALLFLDISKRDWLYGQRKLFGDIDFVVLERDINKLEEYFIETGFENNRNVKMLHGNQRRNFSSPKNISVDCFIENIYLCQNITVSDRLYLSYPTISISDLFLSKIQKHTLTSIDVFDIGYILNFNIEVEYIAELCSSNWNWWKTFQINIPVLINSNLNKKNKKKLRDIFDSINSKKKSIKWKTRNIFGSSIKWYNTVEV